MLGLSAVAGYITHMGTDPSDQLASLAGYWAYAFAVAVAFYGVVSWFGKWHLSQSAKETLTLWLWGEYESTWSQHFCNLFDAVFGAKHLSWRCFIRSALASVLAVLLLYLLFGEVLGVLDPARRTGGDLPIGQALLLGAAINIIPDYLSLFETRWLLKRFERVKSVLGQLGVLVADAVFTGAIIWLAINAFQWATGGRSLAAVEMLALFSVFSLFFYSTFLTSVWAWLFSLSTWFMRLFSRTSLKRVLDVETKPEAQVALVGAVLIFAVALVLTPVLKADEQQPVSVFDDMLCDMFPADICEHLGRLTKDDKRALAYLADACEGGAIEHCMDTAAKYFEGDDTKAAALWRKACAGGDARGCSNLAIMHKEGRGGLPPDDTKAVELFQQACAGGEAYGCVSLGFMHAEGRGVPPDGAKAAELFQQACDDGDARGCTTLGMMHAAGLRGVPPDNAKVVELYQQACDGGDARGCTHLGRMHAEGRGGLPKDDTKAVELFRQACAGGDATGCSRLSR